MVVTPWFKGGMDRRRAGLPLWRLTEDCPTLIVDGNIVTAVKQHHNACGYTPSRATLQR